MGITEQKIQPHKVTKPIQLLAAWLVGLIVTNGSFLVSATQLSSTEWERGLLVIAAVCNVPLFLFALFILQTRFRAELQEDSFYSEYLSKKTDALVRIDKNASQDLRIEVLERSLKHLIAQSPDESAAVTRQETDGKMVLDWTGWPVALNECHPKFKEIRQSLHSADIPLAEIFGDTEVLPKNWLISISHHLPLQHTVHLLRTVLPFNFDGFQFWEPQREADENEDVYVGSYGGGSYAKITDELERLLSGDTEKVDLKHYYKVNRVSVRRRVLT